MPSFRRQPSIFAGLTPVLVCRAGWKPIALLSLRAVVDLGFYQAPSVKCYPRLQSLTVADLLAGRSIDYPQEPEPKDTASKKGPQVMGGELGNRKFGILENQRPVVGKPVIFFRFSVISCLLVQPAL